MAKIFLSLPFLVFRNVKSVINKCRCLWRFTADKLQSVQDNSEWECPCCRPPPALALQYPPQPQPRHRTSLQLGGLDRALRTGGSFSGRPVEGVKRRPSQSGTSSPRGRVSAEVRHAMLFSCVVLCTVCFVCKRPVVLASVVRVHSSTVRC